MNKPATMSLVPGNTASWTTKDVLPLSDAFPHSPAVQDALDELHALSLLEDDWDVHDAPPITPQAISTARVLLELSAQAAYRENFAWPPPDIAPTSSGGVYLHWAGGARPYSVITDASPEAVTLLLGVKNQRSERLVLSLDEASEAVARYMQQDFSQPFSRSAA